MRLVLRGYDLLIIGLAVLAGVVYGLATIGIITDVALRNFGYRPIRATSALVEYSLLFATMAAGPWVLRQGAHVAVNSFVAMLPRGLHRLVMLAVMVLSIAVLALLCWRAVLNGIDELTWGGMDMRSINIPGWVAYALLASGFGLMATEVLRMLLRGSRSMGGTESH
ncbi:MAG: TRAP transporter small permease [Pararhodobacter sp.]|nr:TRAP transporter small permease [Pararhodobacter sp.]